jgi:hypothetical protein
MPARTGEGLAQSLTQTRQAADHITACDGYKPFRYRAESTASTTAWVALEGRPDRWRPLRYITQARAGCKPTTPAVRQVTAGRLGCCSGSRAPEAMESTGTEGWRASGLRHFESGRKRT